MKYLKTYKLFENISDIQSVIGTVEDILIEISDDDIDVSVLQNRRRSQKKLSHRIRQYNVGGEISVTIGDEEVYRKNDITKYIDNIKHMNEYLESEGFNFDFIDCVSGESFWGSRENIQFDDFLNYLKRVEKIIALEITYSKN